MEMKYVQEDGTETNQPENEEDIFNVYQIDRIESKATTVQSQSLNCRHANPI